MKCNYCGKQASQVTGKEIYPHRQDLYHLDFYLCAPCGAYVGTHKASGKPLGTLANNELRMARSRAHRAFDPLWQDGSMKRTEAYAWLANRLCIETKDCHVAHFDLETCENVVRIVAERKEE